MRQTRFFGTRPEFWLNGQQAWDLYRASHFPAARALREIRPLARSA